MENCGWGGVLGGRTGETYWGGVLGSQPPSDRNKEGVGCVLRLGRAPRASTGAGAWRPLGIAVTVDSR